MPTWSWLSQIASFGNQITQSKSSWLKLNYNWSFQLKLIKKKSKDSNLLTIKWFEIDD